MNGMLQTKNENYFFPLTLKTQQTMNTTINNDLRVFMLAGTGWNTQKYFCNMEDIVKCADQFEKNQPYNIYHFWNNVPKKLTAKQLVEILEGNQLDATYFKKAKKTA